MQSLFADAIINITITGPVIRLDFGTAIPVQTPDGKQEVKLNPTQQIVMPLEGFIRSFGLQEQIVKKMIADGIIKVQQPAAQAGQPPASDVISTTGM